MIYFYRFLKLLDVHSATIFNLKESLFSLFLNVIWILISVLIFFQLTELNKFLLRNYPEFLTNNIEGVNVFVHNIKNLCNKAYDISISMIKRFKRKIILPSAYRYIL